MRPTPSLIGPLAQSSSVIQSQIGHWRILKPSNISNNGETRRIIPPLECVAHTTISTFLAADKEKEAIILPPEFSEFADVFKKPKIPLPPHCSFNHTIKLNNSFVPC